MSKVYILGAGFSKWVSNGMPLISDMFLSLPNTTIQELRKENIDSLLAPARFEELISYLAGTYPWKTPEEKYRQQAIYEKISLNISKNIGASEKRINFESAKEEIRLLVRHWIQSKSKIITFNYDTIVEKLFDKAVGNRRWHEYWDLPISNVIQRANIDTSAYYADDYDPKKRYAIITKLHGSINWYRSTHYPQSNEPIFYLPNCAIDLDLRTNLQGLKPFIIPPAMDKSGYLKHEILAILWSRARRQLAGANEIAIVGYSLPISDTYVSLLFASSLSRFSKIYLVNNDKSQEFKEKALRYFERFTIVPDMRFVGIDDSIDQYIKSLQK